MRGVPKNSNKYWDSWHRQFKVSFFLFTYVVTAEAYWHDPSLVKALIIIDVSVVYKYVHGLLSSSLEPVYSYLCWVGDRESVTRENLSCGLII